MSVGVFAGGCVLGPGKHFVYAPDEIFVGGGGGGFEFYVVWGRATGASVFIVTLTRGDCLSQEGLDPHASVVSVFHELDLFVSGES